ncbi:MAG: radical SAM protein [Nitrospinae bacterium]|nr:radical SAM protein [Nitrospinota bacterium]
MENETSQTGTVLNAHDPGTEGNPWVIGQPAARNLGDPEPLPYPTVAEPSIDQMNGKVFPVFPSYIALEVTNVCNLKCTHCNYRFGVDHYTRDRGFMSHETFEKAANEAKENGSPVLMNYDGEPLMHKDYLKFLRHATDLGLVNYFNTNGTLFTPKFADELVKFYKGSVFFSVDGDKKWFETIRIPANYDKVLENISYFLKANEQSGWPITVGISLCNLGQTAQERKAFLDQWLPRVNYVSMGEVNDKFGTMISAPMTVMQPRKRPVCVVPWQTMGVCHNGDVIPCSIYVTRANTANAIMGNIHEQSLKDIWSGKPMADFRKMVAGKRYAESYCDKCERWRCQFGFPAVTDGNVKIERNGFWTTFHNIEKGSLNFRK